MPDRKLEIRLARSIIGLSPKQEATVKALGLRRMHQAVTQTDTPTIRGMIAKVVHVLHVGEASEAGAPVPAAIPSPATTPAKTSKTSAAKKAPAKGRGAEAAPARKR